MTVFADRHDLQAVRFNLMRQPLQLRNGVFMDFIAEAHTDVGIKKKTNQDSILIQMADTTAGKVVFAAVCDGMGGLAKGEVASASLIRACASWFQEVFPVLLDQGIEEETLKESLETVIRDKNNHIMEYGRTSGVSLGTTVVLLLIVKRRYYILNVGDSRVYKITDSVRQLTKDQTFIQREMDMGRMTPEQAKTDPQRNVLLQCVGAGDYLEPDFYSGEVAARENYMLCSDGFRHIITEEELFQYLNQQAANTEQTMKECMKYLTDLNKYRREQDNISVVLIHTY